MTTATRHDPPTVHVITHGRVDPSVVGYALDRLRGVDAEYPVDTVKVELARHGRRMRIELTAALGGRTVRAVNSGSTPRAVIDRAHSEFTEQVDLTLHRAGVAVPRHDSP